MTLTGARGILEELHKRLYERVLGVELTHYLGYPKRRSEALWGIRSKIIAMYAQGMTVREIKRFLS